MINRKIDATEFRNCIFPDSEKRKDLSISLYRIYIFFIKESFPIKFVIIKTLKENIGKNMDIKISCNKIFKIYFI